MIPKIFKIGDRVYDAIYQKVGVVYQSNDIAIQVAFAENITNHSGNLKFQRAYEAKHFCENSRLMKVSTNGEAQDLFA